MNRRAGLSIIEVVVSIALLATLLYLVMGFSQQTQTQATRDRAVSTRDRILGGIRSVARLPASLRNAMRAADGTTPVNPELLACAGGNPLNACQNGVVNPLSLFAPVVFIDAATGQPTGIQQITAPPGVDEGMRFDTFGSPCLDPGPDCILIVSTTFRPQCAPIPLADPPPAVVTPAMLEPRSSCSVAETVEVTFTVRVDPTISNVDTALNGLISPVTDSVVIPVIAISGNTPQ